MIWLLAVPAAWLGLAGGVGVFIGRLLKKEGL